jgi:NADH-quinone oxidoreductase subunit C
MTPKEICGKLADKLGVVLDFKEEKGDPWAVIPPEKWRRACLTARDESELSFNFLRSLCGVDRPDDGIIEIVAHLFSYKHRQAFVMHTRTNRSAPKLDSVSNVWPAAIWHERETFDLFGVDFPGNPDLRRILLPEDWLGHPLRKDYEEPESYHGIPTTRPGYEKKAFGPQLKKPPPKKPVPKVEKKPEGGEEKKE